MDPIIPAAAIQRRIAIARAYIDCSTETVELAHATAHLLRLTHELEAYGARVLWGTPTLHVVVEDYDNGANIYPYTTKELAEKNRERLESMRDEEAGDESPTYWIVEAVLDAPTTTVPSPEAPQED